MSEEGKHVCVQSVAGWRWTRSIRGPVDQPPPPPLPSPIIPLSPPLPSPRLTAKPKKKGGRKKKADAEDGDGE